MTDAPRRRTRRLRRHSRPGRFGGRCHPLGSCRVRAVRLAVPAAPVLLGAAGVLDGYDVAVGADFGRCGHGVPSLLPSGCSGRTSGAGWLLGPIMGIRPPTMQGTTWHQPTPCTLPMRTPTPTGHLHLGQTDSTRALRVRAASEGL